MENSVVAFIGELRDLAEWAEANIWEVPITLPDVLRQAADIIEKYEKDGDAE